MPPAALREPLASGHGTLLGTLLHVLDTEYGWRMLVEQGAETPVLTEQDIPDLAALVERFAAEAAAMQAYLAGLTDAGLKEHVRQVESAKTQATRERRIAAIAGGVCFRQLTRRGESYCSSGRRFCSHPAN